MNKFLSPQILIVSSRVRRASARKLNVINAEEVATMTKKWGKLYGMHQWPPIMPSRAAPHFEDWLMAPLIMSCVNEAWIPQGRKTTSRAIVQ